MDAHFEVIDENTKKTFFSLEKLPLMKNFYLAGGTGLALQIGHRISLDLDFFTGESFDESTLIQKVSEIGDFRLDKKSENSIIGTLNNTKISFLGYKYPLVGELGKISSINIAAIIDIACMKFDAIASRGTKRDFVDVYFVRVRFVGAAVIG